MTRDEALKLMDNKKSCFYAGEFKSLRNKRIFIKQVTRRAAVISTPAGTPGCDDFHIVGLEYLISEEYWKSHQGRLRGAASLM